MPFASAIPLRLYMNPWWWSVYTLGLSNTSWLYMSPSWWSVYTLGLSNTSWPLHVSKMMICIYPWPWQCVLTIHVSMMMICIYPWPRQYILTLCVSMMMICTYPLALAKRLDRMCLHEDLYILLDLAICSDRMCLDCTCLHHDDLYIPLALAIHLDLYMSPRWWFVYTLGLGNASWPYMSPWWWFVYTLGLGNTSWPCVSPWWWSVHTLWPWQNVLTVCVSMMICIYFWT